MNVVPFEYLVAREARSPRFEVFSLCRWDSYLTHDAVGRFFFDFDAPRRRTRSWEPFYYLNLRAVLVRWVLPCS